MKSTQKLYIELEREEKTKLDDVVDVFEEIKANLVLNKSNGFTPFQEELDIYDTFWRIYYICLYINESELIP